MRAQKYERNGKTIRDVSTEAMRTKIVKVADEVISEVAPPEADRQFNSINAAKRESRRLQLMSGGILGDGFLRRAS